MRAVCRMKPPAVASGIRLRIRGRLAAARDASNGDGGFTLIELVMVSVILPVVVGAVALAFIQVMQLQGGITARIADTADAQVVSAHYVKDVESASKLAVSNTPGQQCGTATQTQLLGLEWAPTSSGGYQSVVSYVLTPAVAGYSLVRQYCSNGPSTIPASIEVLSTDIPSNQVSPTIKPASATPANGQWASTDGMTAVKLAITEPGSNYPYTLVANPASNIGYSAGPTQVATPSTGCGFANSGTGSSSLCFVDFGNFTSSGTGSTCANMSAGITGTPFTASFHLCVSGGPVAASAIPTYFAAPTSEAFLGNNGFYTGIPGNPALYQTQEGSANSLVQITNIQVLDATGKAASGWSLVTGDAESTDSSEAIAWSTCTGLSLGSGTPPFPATGSGCSGAPALALVPNSPTSPYGNACHAPISGNWFNVDLSGLNTNTVECAATVDSDKTGTVMLQATQPSALTVVMHGTGLQGAFIGFLLPS